MLGKLLLPVRTRRAAKAKHEQESVGYHEASQIGIIFKYQGAGHYKHVASLIARMEADGKSVSLLVFVSKAESKQQHPFPHYKADSLSAWGQLTSREIDLFLQKNFDFLLNLDLQPHRFVDNILSRSRAKCKIGCYKAQREVFYQLMIHIDSQDNFELFINKVYHYLKKLRANA